MVDYLQRQNELRHQADIILQDLDLKNFLMRFGKVIFVGSYALELMSWEDIDIVVSTNPNYKDYLEAVNYFFPKDNVYSMNIQDFRKSIYPDRPQGIYCGVSYLAKPSTFWKIDIWFMSHSTAIDVMQGVEKKLNNENRSVILKIKNEMRDKTTYGKQVSGMDVYKAVLDEGITTLEDFEKYLRKQGREL